jgi:putative tryptophan/tyrosine transport system substrate-binding protein
MWHTRSILVEYNNRAKVPAAAAVRGQMRRRDFVVMLGAACIGGTRSAGANPKDDVRQIALWLDATERGNANLTVIKRRLDELGWVEARNLHIAFDAWTGDAVTMHSQAAALLSSRPEVIAVQSNLALAILKPMAGRIPIVFVGVADPVGSGFVDTLAHPGGNITGFTNFEPAMGAKWLQVLKEAAPAMTRVLVLMHPETGIHAAFWRSIEALAPSLHVAPVASGVHDAAEIESAIADFATVPNGGVIALPHAVTEFNSDLIIALAKRNRLPSIFAFAYHAAAGALLSYGVQSTGQFRQVAEYVDRILRGAKPSELPVQAANTFELAINLTTAKAIGITIPLSLLARANEVIE